MILVADIQRVVAEAHKVPLEAMRERDDFGTRSRERVWARQEAMFLAREMCGRPGYNRQVSGASYLALARRFNRDHTTIIHGVRAVEQRIATDAEVRRRIDSLSVGLLLR
jgi:chromosomal replication initiator protein